MGVCISATTFKWPFFIFISYKSFSFSFLLYFAPAFIGMLYDKVEIEGPLRANDHVACRAHKLLTIRILGMGLFLHLLAIRSWLMFWIASLWLLASIGRVRISLWLLTILLKIWHTFGNFFSIARRYLVNLDSRSVVGRGPVLILPLVISYYCAWRCDSSMFLADMKK